MLPYPERKIELNTEKETSYYDVNETHVEG